MEGRKGFWILAATIVLVLLACGTFIHANETCSWPWQDCYVGRRE